MTGQQFYEGATVVDAAGDKVGILHAYDAQGGYLTVQKGFLFHTDLYIPLSSVGGTDAAGNVQLRIAKDDLQDERYTTPPLGNGSSDDSDAQSTTVAQTTTTRVQHTPPPAPSAGSKRRPASQKARDDGTLTVQVSEEELVASKRQAETGQVHLHKEVVEERQTLTVPLRRDEVTVERVAVTGQTSQADLTDAFQERDITVPLMGEEAVVGKRAHVVEEVRLRKEVTTEQEQVSGTVRKERVIVDEMATKAPRAQGSKKRRGR